MHRYLVVLQVWFMLCISACSANIAVATAITQTPPVTLQIPTGTPLLSAQPVTIIPPTSFSTPPTPSLPPEIRDNFLFNTGNLPSCKLPCWQGLAIGKSNTKDVQGVLDSIFDFNGAVWYLPPGSWTPPPGMQGIGYIWDIGDQPPSGTFESHFWIDERTDTLEDIHFYWVPINFQPATSPQRIVRELGAPSYWLLSIAGRPLAQIDSVMIYDEGLIFSHGGVVEVRNVLNSNNEITNAIAEFCLDRDDYWGSANIGRPIKSGLDNLSPIQSKYYGLSIKTNKPVQEEIGMRIEELTQLALTIEHPCVSVDLLNR